MNTSFQTKLEGNKAATVEWYTPAYILEQLGKFDLDPCSSKEAWELNKSAEKIYTIEDNGLLQEWYGRVWLNPPYSNPEIKLFMAKMAIHQNGIALLYTRCDSKWFFDYVFNTAKAILFFKKRIRFLKPNGDIGSSPGCGSCLVAYGENNIHYLENLKLEGKLVYL